MISGVLTPNAGDAQIDGIPVRKSFPKAQPRLGSLLDHTGIYSKLTPRERRRRTGNLAGAMECGREVRKRRRLSVQGAKQEQREQEAAPVGCDNNSLTGGLLLIATYRPETHASRSLLVLAVALLAGAAWFGGSTPGPDSVTSPPGEYLKSITRRKAQHLRRAGLAQRIALAGGLIALLTTSVLLRGHPTRIAAQDRLLPVLVLIMAILLFGALAVIRSKGRQELANLREMEWQFEHADVPGLDVTQPKGEEDAVAQTAQGPIARFASWAARGFPNGCAAPGIKRRRKRRKTYL